MSNHKGRSNLKSRTRRQFIVGLGALSTTALFPFKPLFASSHPVDPFLKASSILTGIPLDKSYTQLGVQIWGALIMSMNKSEKKDMESLVFKFAQLPNDTTDMAIKKKLKRMGPNAIAVARKIARVWYTGRIKQPTGRIEVINYDEALVWQACDFTKPPVTCGGSFGYWKNPYQGGRT